MNSGGFEQNENDFYTNYKHISGGTVELLELFKNHLIKSHPNNWDAILENEMRLKLKEIYFELIIEKMQLMTNILVI